MLKILLRRILLLIPTLIGLTLLLFAISRLLPGDPVRLAAGPQASAATIEQMRVEFGLDRSLAEQYLGYLGNLVQGDWGRSVMSRRPVGTDIATFLPATLELVIAALALAACIGVPLGLIAAVRKDRISDYAVRFGSLFALSTPQFFLGLMMQILFAMVLRMFPLGGRFPFVATPPHQVTGLLTVDSLLALDFRSLGLALLHLSLPALVLCLSPMATIIGLMRSSTIGVLQQDYVRTARAFGLSERRINFKYVLRNAFGATLTVIGLYFGWLLGGTVIVETVFDWPGIGLYATKAIVSQDFMPVIGVALVVGLLFIVTNIVVDLLQRVVNPRTEAE